MPTLIQIFLPAIVLLTACGNSKKSSSLPSNEAYPNHRPDYADLRNWAAHPGKYDPSDSTPEPYLPMLKDTSVDVFFLHPTTYLNDEAIANKPYETRYWNASVLNEALNKLTDESSILNQASPFNKYRVFAPRYRQAHIRSFSLADSLSAPFFDTAYTDVKRAFDYYVQYQNNGRPFIIASHSQGTLHAGRLIKEMIEGKPLQKMLVAAYIIGLAVPTTYFDEIKVCDEPSATGCFVSWRTYKKGYVPERVLAEKERSFVVNPISWKTDTNWVSRKYQKGAVLYKFNRPKPNNVGAGIHGNVLWSNKPRFAGNIFFTRKNYHIGDINLFWKDIRDNADDRVRAYKETYRLTSQ